MDNPLILINKFSLLLWYETKFEKFVFGAIRVTQCLYTDFKHVGTTTRSDMVIGVRLCQHIQFP